jgi:tight adherence protein B
MMTSGVPAAGVTVAVLVVVAVLALPARGEAARDRAARVAVRPQPGRAARSARPDRSARPTPQDMPELAERLAALRAQPGRAARSARPDRSARPTPQDMPELAERLAALLRAGLPPSRAWTAVASADDRAAAAARGVLPGLQLGLAGGRALWLGAAPRHRPGVVPLAVALDLCERTGAPTADVLDGLAAALRAQEAAVLEAEVALAAPRATAKVLGLLPAAGLGLSAALGVDTLHVLVATAPGRACLLLGAACWWAGRSWTARLVAAARRGEGDP